MRLLHAWKPDAAMFDDENLVSAAGLVPVLALAEHTHLPELIQEQVRFDSERIVSAAANPVGKIMSIIAGMLTGADSIADLQVIRSGGSQKMFGAVYAPSTLGMFLREFTHGNTRQLSAVLARHLLALATRTAVLAGIEVQAFIDIDSLLRPVYGHAKQGASFGHTKIANRQVLRKGLSPLVTTISTAVAAPVIAESGCGPGKPGPDEAPPAWSPKRSTWPSPPAPPPPTCSSAVTQPTATAMSSPPSCAPARNSRWCSPKTER